MRILVTGAAGLLGRKILTLGSHEHQIIGTFHSNKTSDDLISLDLSNLDIIMPFLDLQKPQVIIYTAGVVDERLAEEQPRLAKTINADAAHIMAIWCERNRAKMVYVSTDYVFDGETVCYDESSKPYPLQIYGFTKLLGELLLSEYHTCAVLRVGILHGFNDFRDKLTDTIKMVQTLKNGKNLVLDHHRIKYPYLIDDVAKCLLLIAQIKESGIFHLGGGEGVTRYEWGCRVAKVFGLDSSQLIPDPKKDVGTFPQRPVNVKLIDTRLGFEICGLDKSLLTIKRQISETGSFIPNR
jgi:dTDP-4-dehydrorhamnose reductase